MAKSCGPQCSHGVVEGGHRQQTESSQSDQEPTQHCTSTNLNKIYIFRLSEVTCNENKVEQGTLEA